MTPEQSKTQAKLDQRAKELKAQEEYLDQYERSFKSRGIDIKVVDEKIKFKTKKLVELNKEYNTLHESLALGIETNDNTLKSLKLKENEKLNNIDKLARKIEVIKTEISEQREELDNIKADIRTTTEYYVQQEELVDSAVLNANDNLKALKYEIDSLTIERDSLVREVNEAKLATEEAKQDLVIAEGERDSKLSEYQQSLTDANTSLEEQLKKIDEASIKYKMIVKEIEEKQKQLDLKEKSLLIKITAYQEDKSQLETDKRRWQGTKSLYDNV